MWNPILKVYFIFFLLIQLTSLELVSEGVVGVMEEKGKELKRAKTVRSEYTADVDEIQHWLRQAELKVQDRTVQPLKLKEYIQVCVLYRLCNECIFEAVQESKFLLIHLSYQLLSMDACY